MESKSQFESPEWAPSARQFDRYVSREVELCARERLKRPSLRPLDTLFSLETWAAATPRLALEQVRRSA